MNALSRLNTLLSSNAIIFDTETTGLSSSDHVIELSVIDTHGATLFSSLINPGVSVSSIITNLTGITNDMLLDVPTFDEVADDIEKVFAGRTALAWNAGFDVRMIGNEFSRIGRQNPARDAVDVMSLYCSATNKPSRQYKLERAKVEMGVGDGQDHRSLQDCLDTLNVLKAVVGDEEKDLFATLTEPTKVYTAGAYNDTAYSFGFVIVEPNGNEKAFSGVLSSDLGLLHRETAGELAGAMRGVLQAMENGNEPSRLYIAITL